MMGFALGTQRAEAGIVCPQELSALPALSHSYFPFFFSHYPTPSRCTLSSTAFVSNNTVSPHTSKLKCSPRFNSRKVEDPTQVALFMASTHPLTVRTALLEALAERQRAHDQEGRTNDNVQSSPSTSASVAEAMVRGVPALDDPAWAMEELLRTCPRTELWSGSALPETVWAAAGTTKCPFGTGPSDFVR